MQAVSWPASGGFTAVCYSEVSVNQVVRQKQMENEKLPTVLPEVEAMPLFL